MHATKETMTGREAEEGFLGKVDSVNKKYRFFLLRRGIPEGLLKNISEHTLPRISFSDALEMAKIGQPWKDPANPEKDFLRELRIEVADALGIGQDEKALERLCIYTAVGSPLDILHKIDFFVEYKQKDGHILRVKCDLTENPARKKNMGDILVVDANAIGDPANDEKRYLDAIQGLAQNIARNFRAQESRFN